MGNDDMDCVMVLLKKGVVVDKNSVWVFIMMGCVYMVRGDYVKVVESL